MITAVSRIRTAPGVRLRREDFGAVAYVPSTGRVHALDREHADVALDPGRGADPAQRDVASRLAAAGIVDVSRAPSPAPGRASALLGSFPTPPVAALPLVVNCLVTAFCALRCRYCHADDLMGPFQAGESAADVPRIVATASAVPALVAVVAGGDPAVRPERARTVIEALAPDKAVVVDSSGVGDLGSLLPVLREAGGHLRVSLDTPDAGSNDRIRPVAGRFQRMYGVTGAYDAARRAIGSALAAGVPTTVQTVVGAHNEDPGVLLRLGGQLRALGVRGWVLHVMVPAGKAARPGNAGLAASPGVLETLAAVAAEAPLDVRITATHRRPNAVLLVNSRGDLYVEGGGVTGKTMVAASGAGRAELVREFVSRVDLAAHSARYLDGDSAAGSTAPTASRANAISSSDASPGSVSQA